MACEGLSKNRRANPTAPRGRQPEPPNPQRNRRSSCRKEPPNPGQPTIDAQNEQTKSSRTRAANHIGILAEKTAAIWVDCDSLGYYQVRLRKVKKIKFKKMGKSSAKQEVPAWDIPRAIETIFRLVSFTASPNFVNVSRLDIAPNVSFSPTTTHRKRPAGRIDSMVEPPIIPRSKPWTGF